MASLSIALLMAGAMAMTDADSAGDHATPAVAKLEPAFENTLRITYGDGRIGRMWLDRDGGYRGHGRRQSSGAWRLREDQLCFTQRRPIPIPIPFCTPIIDNPQVGSRWAARSVTGENVVIEIVRGR